MGERELESQELEEKPLLEFKKLRKINVNEIIPNRYNPREKISKKEVSDIRDSIREMGGILVPLVVYEVKKEDKTIFVLLDGERRWRAAKELAKHDSQYSEVPCNIIQGPLPKEHNFRTMFNIHMERKQWSTAAIAMAVGELMKLNPNITVTELSEKTHASASAIREAQAFLKMPPELRTRCLEGDLDEYYLIFLARAFSACERLYPQLFEKNGWHDLAREFIKKVDSGLIGRARDINLITEMARKCIEYGQEALFVETFQKMVTDTKFTPLDADRFVDSKLGYKVDSLFRSFCKDFQTAIGSYSNSLNQKEFEMPLQTRQLLTEIHDKLASLLK